MEIGFIYLVRGFDSDVFKRRFEASQRGTGLRILWNRIPQANSAWKKRMKMSIN